MDARSSQAAIIIQPTETTTPHMSKQQLRENARAKDDAIPLDFNAAPRVAQALRLRRLGWTYEQIAPRLGYSNESSVRSAVKRANQKIIRDEAQALVGWQLDMIDQALQVVMTRIAINDPNSLWAVDRLVPLLKRQAELMGLDVKDAGQQAAQVVVRAYPKEWIDALAAPAALEPPAEESAPVAAQPQEATV